MKKYIQHNLILFALLNLCTPLLSSENNWSLKKPITSHKNWFQSKIDAYSDKLITRHSYTHNSFEHVRDMALLHLLPAPIAQSILFAQRNNMKKFLLKNEENALEEVRQYFNIDQKEWSGIISQAKKDCEFNLNEMRKDQNFNTYHDPDVNIFMPEIKNACKKYSINPKSLHFGAQTAKPNDTATAESFPPIQKTYYIPGKINLNKEFLVNRLLPAGYINHVAFHELTHIIQGHLTQELTILNHLDIGYSFRIGKLNAYIKYLDSIARKNLVAAQEKTADTFLSCSDPEVAKINATHTQNSIINGYDGKVSQLGYPDNFNDMLVINTNWETSESIKKSRKTLQSLKKKIQQATNLA